MTRPTKTKEARTKKGRRVEKITSDPMTYSGVAKVGMQGVCLHILTIYLPLLEEARNGFAGKIEDTL